MSIKQKIYWFIIKKFYPRDHKNLFLKSIKERRDGSALQYASEEFKTDREIVLAAVNSDGSSLEYAAEHFKSDREIVLAAVMNSRRGSALKYAADHFKSDREIVLAAVMNSSRWGDALEYAAEHFKSDREIVLAALMSNGSALKHVSYALIKDIAFLREVVKIMKVRETKN
jgi:hypothetical protein